MEMRKSIEQPLCISKRIFKKILLIEIELHHILNSLSSHQASQVPLANPPWFLPILNSIGFLYKHQTTHKDKILKYFKNIK